MKIIAIKECSAGNDRVGEMWKETKIFDENDTLGEVMEWVGNRTTNCIITVPEDDEEELKERIRQNISF